MTQKNKTQSVRIAFMSTMSSTESAYYVEEPIKFTWYMGMSWQVRQRSSQSLREEILNKYPGRKIIEISTASDNYELGRQLSALNLTFDGIPVENIFQGSKVYSGENEPHVELFSQSAKDAKRFSKEMQTLKRAITGFKYNGKTFDAFPYSSFYDWIYINALHQHPKLARNILGYDTFTDIHFNQKVAYSDKGPFNCQARALAIYVSLVKQKTLEEYLQDPERLKYDIYRELYKTHKPEHMQLSLM